MQLKSLKDIEQLIKICKKHGIEDIEVGTVKMRVPKKTTAESATDRVETETPYSDEDVVNWSSQISEVG